jgi:hypothetical protein
MQNFGNEILNASIWNTVEMKDEFWILRRHVARIRNDLTDSKSCLTEELKKPTKVGLRMCQTLCGKNPLQMSIFKSKKKMGQKLWRIFPSPFFFFWSGIKRSPLLLRQLTGLLYRPDDDECGAIGWQILQSWVEKMGGGLRRRFL